MADKKPANDPQAAQQQAQQAAQAQQQAELRQAGVTDTRHHALVQRLTVRGVNLSLILDAVRKFGPGVLDLVEQIAGALAGGQGEPPAPTAQPAAQAPHAPKAP